MGIVTRQSSNTYRTRGIHSKTVWMVYDASAGDLPRFTYSTGSDIVFHIGSSSVFEPLEVQIVESSQPTWQVPPNEPGAPTQPEPPRLAESELAETVAWLKLAESSFDFWDNEEDSIYDDL